MFLFINNKIFNLNKAKDYLKLTKKTIIDKNGKKKTVYVRIDFNDKIKNQIEKYIESIRNDIVENSICLDSNGKVLVHKIGSENNIFYTKREITKMKGAKLYIHNHPNGSSFSIADISFLLHNNIKKIVAVGSVDNKKINYSLELLKSVDLVQRNNLLRGYLETNKKELENVQRLIYDKKISQKKATRFFRHFVMEKFSKKNKELFKYEKK